MSIVYAESNTFKTEIASGLVLVDFYADWCGPCKMIAPLLEEISKETNDIKIVKVNVDTAPDVAGQFSIMSIPTLIIFKDGKPLESKLGFQSKDMLLNWINQHK